jgi:hypothetical protein
MAESNSSSNGDEKIGGSEAIASDHKHEPAQENGAGPVEGQTKSKSEGRRRFGRARRNKAAAGPPETPLKPEPDLEVAPEPEIDVVAEANQRAAEAAQKVAQGWGHPTADFLAERLSGFVSHVKPTQADDAARNDVVKRFNDFLIKNQFHGCRAEFFGSSLSGFHGIDSDCDLSLNVAEDFLDMIRSRHPNIDDREVGVKVLAHVSKALRRPQFGAAEVRLIPRARCPLFNYIDKKTGLSCDVSLGNDGAIH